LLQHWFNLSDPAAEEALHESLSKRRFVGVDLGREPVPDETRSLNFRRLLEQHELRKPLFERINQHFAACGRRVAGGTIVDATIIAVLTELHMMMHPEIAVVLARGNVRSRFSAMSMQKRSEWSIPLRQQWKLANGGRNFTSPVSRGRIEGVAFDS
jgi:IS5 family transposase